MKLNVGTYLNKGKYRIEKVLGQGSFGITYLATVNIVGTLGTIASSTKVAIKEFFMREVNGRNEETVTILTGKERNMLLLDIIPFDICFGSQWEKAIPMMIEAGTTISIRKSDSFDFVGTDFVSGKISNRIHLIDLIEDLGYAPKEIECTVEVGTSLEYIIFEVTDKSTGKSKSYSIENLTSLHWEACKEEEWT